MKKMFYKTLSSILTLAIIIGTNPELQTGIDCILDNFH